MHWTSLAIIAGGLAALLLVWRIDILIHPYGRCRWCKGTGRNWGSRKGAWGKCWFCKGKPRYRRGARKPRRGSGKGR